MRILLLCVCCFTSQAIGADLKTLVAELETRCKTVNQITDYTCTLTKRERVNGVLHNYEQATAKVRHAPFSVYMKFSYPPEIQGREVLYVVGKNNGNILVRKGGPRLSNITVDVNPFSPAALERSRYPITLMGLKNLLDRLLEVGREELQTPQQELTIKEVGVSVNSRQCRMIEVMHTVRRSNYRYYIARLYIDKQLNIPIRQETYGWTLDGSPLLLEEYTYSDVVINVGLTDKDFDQSNPMYQFH